MRVVLVLVLLALAGAGGYGYFDLVKRLNETQRRLAEAETVIAKDRNALRQVWNDYASARKVEQAINHHQGQINGLRGDVQHIRGDYAAAQKVDARLAGIERQVKDQLAGLQGQGAGLAANLTEVRTLLAATLALLGSDELKTMRFTNAEVTLRVCLGLREKMAPNDWMTFNAKSMLGESLLGQKKYADAEPILLAGYEGMRQRKATIPESVRTVRMTAALERLVQLYDAWNKKDRADQWREKVKAEQKTGK